MSSKAPPRDTKSRSLVGSDPPALVKPNNGIPKANIATTIIHVA